MKDHSAYLQEAQEILASVEGKSLSLEERKRLSIDLASLLLRESNRILTPQEKRLQYQLARLMRDPVGKAFTTAMTDECFRSHHNRRIADQMIYLLHRFGVPQYLNWFKRWQLAAFRAFGPNLAQFLVPLATDSLRKETARVILPGEHAQLEKHILQRETQKVHLNFNHLGEAILSEKEAKNRLRTYLDDLKNPHIDYISVKISTIYSQISSLDFDNTVQELAERLRLLYRAAMKTTSGKQERFINLDMEEYRDLRLTVALFCMVLEEPEFFHHSAGIVLQAYLPDSHSFQRQLTEWAQKRVSAGGAPIKIRIVKGANLAMEQFEASVRGWPQSPYTSKSEVDSNFKRMVTYGCNLAHAQAVRLGIASHNLFDIAFAMLLRAENKVDQYVGFEMLEGMADHMRRVVQALTGDILLYCPIATRQEFQHAIAYLIRRLDENTGPENFLRHVFGLKPGTEVWDQQTALFSQSCDEIASTTEEPRRTQNRLEEVKPSLLNEPFDNEPDTDFSLPQNAEWGQKIAQKWQHVHPKAVPLVIQGEELFPNQEGICFSPSNPQEPLYCYAQADENHIEQAIVCAKNQEKTWGTTSPHHRSELLSKVAYELRKRRGDLIGAMMLDGGKTLLEADPEVSEAIDFAEYYRRRMERMSQMSDVEWHPKGTALVIPPWNFPCAIPVGGICAALAAGNCVLLKPSSEAVLVAWELVKAFWDAGISKEVLQFIPCLGSGSGSLLVKDPRINVIALTGGTDTAYKFLQMRPDLDLAAETGGKNSMIITGLADRDLAIKDLIHSAFSHNGQKCSAASLAILEAEVYDDAHFLYSLKEAVASLPIGTPWDLSARITPLIHAPKGVLKRALTTLEPGEEWLLEPKVHPENPQLWSPGIKLGVQPGGFTHQTELFGPVLGLMRAENLEHALELANGTPYGLTAGLHSLDEREQKYWLKHIEAGNCYINRATTGAIVRRQPFGGTKASCFGAGAKAGGPNYLREFLEPVTKGLPQAKLPVNDQVNQLTTLLEGVSFSAEELGTWYASIANYAYWWKRLKQDRDPSKLVGQDNLFRYIPRKKMTLRMSTDTSRLDVLRVCAAALTVGAELEISYSPGEKLFDWQPHEPLSLCEETENEFLERVQVGQIERVRILDLPSRALYAAAAKGKVYLAKEAVLSNGRWELLHYLREVSISIDYHRYGNLGLREGELRKPIL